MFDNFNDVLTIPELMKALNIGRNKAYELINSGSLRTFRIGKKHKIPKKSLIAYIDQEM